MLIKEAVGTTSWEEPPGSNWIHISLDSVPWLPSHPFDVSLEFVPKVYIPQTGELTATGNVRLLPLPLVSLTTSTVMPQGLLDPQVSSQG